ncbi:MAG: hypothetical protein QXX18_09195 [Candidatus Jordarchaeales archaeon]
MFRIPAARVTEGDPVSSLTVVPAMPEVSKNAPRAVSEKNKGQIVG